MGRGLVVSVGGRRERRVPYGYPGPAGGAGADAARGSSEGECGTAQRGGPRRRCFLFGLPAGPGVALDAGLAWPCGCGCDWAGAREAEWRSPEMGMEEEAEADWAWAWWCSGGACGMVMGRCRV